MLEMGINSSIKICMQMNTHYITSDLNKKKSKLQIDHSQDGQWKIVFSSNKPCAQSILIPLYQWHRWHCIYFLLRHNFLLDLNSNKFVELNSCFFSHGTQTKYKWIANICCNANKQNIVHVNSRRRKNVRLALSFEHYICNSIAEYWWKK